MPVPEIGIIVNGKARLRYEAHFQKLKQILHDRRKSFAVKETTSIHEVPLLMRDFLQDKVSLVFVFGGDGTLHAAAQAFIEDGATRYPYTALVPLPFGTGNDFFQGLFPRSSRDDLSWIASPLQRRPVSLGQVRDAQNQVRYFLNSFSIGITVSILKDYEGSRFRSYFLSTLKTLPRYRSVPLEVNGQRHDTLLFMVCKGPLAGGGMRLHADAHHHQPKVLWVPRVSLPFAFRHLSKLYRGGLASVPGVRSFPFEDLQIDGGGGGEMVVEMDGETFQLESPLQLELRPALISIAGPYEKSR